jgi:hypothetical protein
MNTLHAALVVVAGSLANLLIAAMFIARVKRPDRARLLGFLGTAMALPLAAAGVIAWVEGMDTWDIALPLVFVAFAVIEIGVDVVADFDVRSSRWLWPYLMSFYVAQWAVVGAAFRVSETGGAVVLVTYFVCLAATAYSYRRVGHGAGRHPSIERDPAAA